MAEHAHSDATGLAPTHDHEHPGESVYVRMVAALAIITIVEVAIYYIDAVRPILIPLLVVLSAVKFVGVVGWFMHLKFDDSRLIWIFVAALVIAVALIAAVWAMQTNMGFFVGQRFS